MAPTGDLRIGVAGSDDGHEASVTRAIAGVETAGATPVRDDPAALADRALDAAILVGEGALLAAVRAGAGEDYPVLPVGAGRGVWSVPVDAVEAGARSVVAGLGDGSGTERTLPRLSVRVGDDRYRALFDLMVVTSEAARISEYAVTTATGPVATVRADGIVVATPAGSRGYAAAADAPALSPATDALAVAPVAPFVTDRDQWVLADEGLTLRVTRDEGAVSLLVDDREVARIGPDRPVTVARDGGVRVSIVPESRRFWPDERRDWKNSNVGTTD